MTSSHGETSPVSPISGASDAAGLSKRPAPARSPAAAGDSGVGASDHGGTAQDAFLDGPHIEPHISDPGDRTRPTGCRCAPMLRRLEAIYASEGAPTLHTPPAADLRYTELYRPDGPPLPIALTGRGRHYLYRLHTRDGLGYVGIADDYKNRLNQHALEKAWWPEIRMAHVHGFTTRDEAYRMESFVIRSDRPPFNLADGPVWSYMQALVQLAEREQAEQKGAA